MANTVTSIKRVRITERRTGFNRLRKSRMRTQVRKFRKILEAKDVNAAQAALPATFSMIDRAAKWGIIKKAAAARYKSRLSTRVKQLAAPAA